jgi:hypothetical protein
VQSFPLYQKKILYSLFYLSALRYEKPYYVFRRRERENGDAVRSAYFQSNRKREYHQQKHLEFEKSHQHIYKSFVEKRHAHTVYYLQNGGGRAENKCFNVARGKPDSGANGKGVQTRAKPYPEFERAFRSEIICHISLREHFRKLYEYFITSARKLQQYFRVNPLQHVYLAAGAV